MIGLQNVLLALRKISIVGRIKTNQKNLTQSKLVQGCRNVITF